METSATIVASVLALASLMTGCLDTSEAGWLTLEVQSRYHEDRYIEAWVPEDISDGVGTMIGPSDGRGEHQFQTSLPCPTSVPSALHASQSEYTNFVAGRSIESKSWDLKDCDERYLLLIDEQGALNLYHCEPRSPREPCSKGPALESSSHYEGDNRSADLTFNGTVAVAANPANVVMADCEFPVHADCPHFEFTVTEEAAARDDVPTTITLTWSQATNDFDLGLYRDGEFFHSANAGPPGTQEQLSYALPAGAYTIVVKPYLVVDDAFQVTVDFQ